MSNNDTATNEIPSELERPAKRARTTDESPCIRNLPSKNLLSDMPFDVVEAIISQVSCQISLHGAIAKVSQEFRNIAKQCRVVKAVRSNFCRDHLKRCEDCRYIVEMCRGEGKGNQPMDDATINMLVNEVKDRLCYAAQEGLLPCIMFFNTCMKWFLFDFSDGDYTPLHEAAAAGQLDMCRYLVDEIGHIEYLHFRNDEGGTVLHSAAEGGHMGTIRYIMEDCDMASSVGEMNMFNESVLHMAARNGHLEALQYFIEKVGMSDLLKQDDDLRASVIEAAACKAQLHVLRYLSQRAECKPLPKEEVSVFLIAVSRGFMDIVRYYIDERGDSAMIHAKSEDGDSVLHLAADEGQVDVLRYLMQKGASTFVDEKNVNGATALQVAIEREHPEVERCLKEYGAKCPSSS